jgi:histone chaperone ASF1
LRRCSDRSWPRSPASHASRSSGTSYSPEKRLSSLADHHRDTEESAPPEFPPEQPEADLIADGDQYGLEEEDDEDDEEEEGVAAAGEDAAMDGAEDTAGPAGDEDSDAGSEDIDIEESEGEDEEEEDDGDDDMEMDDGEANGKQPQQQQPGSAAHGADVMVH